MAKKIVVVDDSQSIREEVASLLRKNGYEVLTALDGLDGARKIASLPDVALVLCDVDMPRMNGFELLMSMKQDPKLAAVPIVMLTAEGQPSLIARARAAGAKGWIVKPFKPELLTETVRRLTA